MALDFRGFPVTTMTKTHRGIETEPRWKHARVRQDRPKDELGSGLGAS